MKKVSTVSKIQISWKYFYFTLSCAAILIVIEITGKGFYFKEIFNLEQVSYLVVSLYTIIPFFLLWSLLNMFVIKEEQKRLDDNTNIPITMEQLLFDLEKKTVFQLENYQNMMKKSEFYGKAFSVFSLIIPGMSWGYVFLTALGSDELPNLGLFGFSSMTAGGLIGVSVGITLLKHSKAIQPYVEKLSDEVIHLRKLRIICLSRHEFLEYDNLMLKVVDALLVKNMGEQVVVKDNKESSNGGKDGGMDLSMLSMLGGAAMGGDRGRKF